MKKYLILSLSRSPGRLAAVWWKPNRCGYTENIDEAGRYDELVVFADESYYNNDITTLAIPENEVLKVANVIKIVDHEKWRNFVVEKDEG